MFSFLTLINNSVTAGLTFFITNDINNHIINSDQYFMFLFGLYSSIFSKPSSISFEYSIKALESFKYFLGLVSLLLTSNRSFASKKFP